MNGDICSASGRQEVKKVHALVAGAARGREGQESCAAGKGQRPGIGAGSWSGRGHRGAVT